jgi:hypothetical protein
MTLTDEELQRAFEDGSLARHYIRARLMSDQARQTFVLPDLEPVPSVLST